MKYIRIQIQSAIKKVFRTWNFSFRIELPLTNLLHASFVNIFHSNLHISCVNSLSSILSLPTSPCECTTHTSYCNKKLYINFLGRLSRAVGCWTFRKILLFSLFIDQLESDRRLLFCGYGELDILFDTNSSKRLGMGYQKKWN